MKFVLLICVIFSSFFGFSQNLTYHVEGKLTNTDTKKVEAGVTISFVSNGKVVASVVTAPNGKYDLKADAPVGAVFQVTYSKPGFVTKKINFNGSKMKPADVEGEPEFPLPTLDLELFMERPNANFSFLNTEPVALFFWDDLKLVVAYDKEASSKTKKKIDDLLAATASKNPDEAEYQQAIKAGAEFFAQKKYQEALEQYEEAMLIKPKDPLPIAKVAELDKILKEIKKDQRAYEKLMEQYNNLVEAADNLRNKAKYLDAIEKYKEAALKKPDETYPKEEIARINEKFAKQIAEEKALLIKFETLKKEGLALFDAKKWEESKEKLEAAIAIKEDPLITQKLKDINAALKALEAKAAVEKEKTDRYASVMKVAEGLLSSGKLEEAKSKFNEASIIDPEQPLPKQKITEINNLIALNAKKAKVDKLIADGNNLIAKNELTAAKSKFDEVLKEDPSDKVAPVKIQEINAKLEAQKLLAEKDAKFEALKKEGMALASDKKYKEAKTKLEQAIAVKADEGVSKKLAEIDKLVKDAEAQLALDEEFKKIMTDAASIETAKNYDGAIAKYKEASAKKPSEELPKTKIAALEKLKADLAKEAAEKAQAEKDAKFEALKKEGFTFASEKKYKEAKSKLELALAVKADEGVTKKIAEIEKSMKDEEAQMALNEEFKKIMADAASLETAKNIDGAIAKYKEASAKKPSEELPKTKIAALEKLKADQAKEAAEKLAAEKAQAEKDAKFEALKKEGLALAVEKKYKDAKSKLEQALAVKADEGVTNKIAEIEKSLKDEEAQMALNEEFKKIMADAASLETAKNIDGAIAKYKEASAKKPSEELPKTKIAALEKLKADQAKEAADKLLAEKAQAEKDAKFEALKKEGLALASEKKYKEAKSKLEQAIAVKADGGVSQKIAEIEKIMKDAEAQIALEEEFKKLMTDATSLESSKNYDGAISKYKEASTKKPSEELPKTKIAALEKLKADLAKEALEKEMAQKGQAEKDAKFEALKKEGMTLASEKKYKDAKSKLEQALSIKSDDGITKKIAEIEKAMKDEEVQMALNDEFKKIMVDAASLESSKNYDGAIAKYKEALAKKPSEELPKTKIAAIEKLKADLAKEASDKLLAEKGQAEKDAKFEALKKEGFTLATEKKYKDAKSKLEQALTIKADASVSQKLAEIEKEIKATESQNSLEEEYKKLLSEASNLESSKNYDGAISKYKEALAKKPSEELPKTKIAALEKIKADLAKEAADKLLAEKGQAAEKEAKFEALKKEGFTLATEKKYKDAKSKLEQALAIKSDASVSQKLAEIEKDMKAAESQNSIEEEYKKLLSEASNLESSKNYDGAINKYKEASVKKPSEELPKTKIAALEKIKADLAKEAKAAADKLSEEKGQAEKESKFQALKKEGFTLATEKKYKDAKSKLEQALTIKSDSEVSQKIVEIEKALKDSESQQSVDEVYARLMKEAGGFESVKKYDAAIAKYKEASVKKPSEELPKTKIAELEKLKADLAKEESQKSEAQKEALYSSYMSKGTKNLGDKQYELALIDFQNALGTKPNDNEAKTKIAEVKKLISDLEKTKNKENDSKKIFEKLMSDADRFFKQEKYLDAKTLYEKALVIVPNNQLAIDQIAKCDLLEKEKGKKEGDGEYKKLLSAADKRFNDKDYSKAKEYYQRALGIRNTDPYPKKRIEEIDALLNPKPVVDVAKVEIDPEKLQPLGIPYEKSIIDGNEELKKAEIERERIRLKELKSGTSDVNDKSEELADEKHQERLKTTKSVFNVNGEIEKQASENDKGHQEVIESNKKAQKEQNDFNDKGNALENSDHLQIQEKMDLVSNENQLDFDTKNAVFVDKGDIMKKHETKYENQKTAESEKFDTKKAATKEEIKHVEQKIIDEQLDDVETRKAVEERIEKSVNITIDQTENLYNTETSQNLNSQNQVDESAKKMDNKFDIDIKNPNEISVDLVKVKEKVQQSTDTRSDKMGEQSDQVTAQIVDLNKRIAAEALVTENQEQVAVEYLKANEKEIFDNLNDDYNKEMLKYLTSKGDIDTKLNKIEASNVVTNKKAVEENGEINKMSLSVSNENEKQNSAQIDKNRTAQKSIHDKQFEVAADKPIIANSIGKEYPEGVSQESFTQNDENGLMKAIITRRIVVVGGKGDVYVRTQTLNTITYSKNGEPSSERVWQKETQGPSLVKNY